MAGDSDGDGGDGGGGAVELTFEQAMEAVTTDILGRIPDDFDEEMVRKMWNLFNGRNRGAVIGVRVWVLGVCYSSLSVLRRREWVGSLSD